MLTIWLLPLLLNHLVTAEYGVLLAQTETERKYICIRYYPHLHKLPTSLENVIPHHFFDARPWDGCSSFSGLNDTVVVAGKGNCSLTEVDQIVGASGGAGFVLTPATENEFNLSESSDVDIRRILAIMGEKAIEDVTAMKNAQVYIYAPPEPASIDIAMVAILLLATMSFTIGSYWSGWTRLKLKYELDEYLIQRLRECVQNALEQTRNERPANEDGEDAEAAKEDEVTVESPGQKKKTPLRSSVYFPVGLKHVMIYVLVICAILTLMYFFFNYLVYVMIFMFCVGSINAMFLCFRPFLQLIPGTDCKWSCPPSNILVRDVLLFCACLGIAIWFLVIRNESYSWILQDMMGFCFAAVLIKSVRLQNLKIIMALMVLLFLYDIFFVFITPIFTEDKQSIMVKVATGTPTSEKIPMVLRMPRFYFSPLHEACGFGYFVLGLGDIIVPGLLGAYVTYFGMTVGRVYVYFIPLVAGYIIGLIVTVLALFFMSSAQPALTYLVPMTLLPTIIIGVYRREFRHLWDGIDPNSPDFKICVEGTQGNRLNSNRSDHESFHEVSSSVPNNRSSLEGIVVNDGRTDSEDTNGSCIASNDAANSETQPLR